MDKLQLIAEIKRLVGNADIEHALQRLVEELEKAGSSFANDAIQAQSLFQKTQKDEKQGLVSFENARLNYNQVTDQILDLLEALKKESGSEIQGKPAKRLLPWIVGGVLVLAAVIAALVFSNNEAPPATVDTSCPNFGNTGDTTTFNILVLPFLAVTEESQGTNTDVLLIQKLEQFKAENKIKTAIGRYGIKPQEEIQRYTEIITNTAQLAKNCMAQLIIWGSNEKQLASAGTIVTANYKFLNTGSKTFAFDRLKILEGSETVAVSALSNIQTEGVLTEELETNIKILLGIIANETGNPEAAMALLENIETTDSATVLLWGMTLADSQIKAKQPEKALESYNKILEKHPHYNFALNNRAAINYKMGKNAEALNDLDTIIMLKPDANKLVDAFIARGTIHLKTQSLDKAAQDVNAASKLTKSKDDKNIQRLNTAITKEKTAQLEIKKEAERKLQANPENTEALEVKASADKALGNEKEALTAAKAAVANNSTDPQVFSIILEEAERTKDTNTFKRIVKKAEQAGISRKELIQNAPLLEPRLRTTIRQ